MKKTFSLYLHTLSYLKLKQINYRLWYLFRRQFQNVFLSAKKKPADYSVHRKFIKPYVVFPDYPWFTADYISKNSFCFLNDTEKFEDQINWRAEGKNRLWRYNLHYFQYLLTSDDLDQKHGILLIKDWIHNNSKGTVDAWNPYPISLRIVNWIKYLSKVDLTENDYRITAHSIYLQTLQLEKSLEKHLLANHFFKNLKGLVFAGVFFKGENADRWMDRGLRCLTSEISEQILPDGGHFERSPMYHCMILEDCLDLLNITYYQTHAKFAKFKELLILTCSRMIRFLSGILHPDGDIPLFNDSAFGIELPPDRLLGYASSLIPIPDKITEDSCRSFSASGYFVISPNPNDRMIIDCGPIGPEYQPGHAHCDTLSYELALNGRRIIVDSGVYDYRKGPMRDYVRSTKAHNTVSVDQKDQSEIWGAFRVARRAVPIYGVLDKLTTGEIRFRGAHDGYKRLPGNVVHERCVKYQDHMGWTVIDSIKGSGNHLVESFIHIHADFKAVACKDGLMLKDRNTGDESAQIRILMPLEVRIEKGWYCPEFGKKIRNDVIVLSRQRYLPTQIGYNIMKV